MVPKHDNVDKVIWDHAEIRQEVKAGLVRSDKALVNQNPVHRFRTADNRECFAILQDVLDHLGLAKECTMNIDASAGDLWTGKGYIFSITDGSSRTTEESQKYWMELIRQSTSGFWRTRSRNRIFQDGNT